MIVLDANILIRAILGRRARHLIETYSLEGVRFFAPDVSFDDAAEYLPLLLEKRGKSDTDIAESLDYLRTMVSPVDRELYAIFENEARERLHGRDEDDWPVLASALALACGIWTEDADFFGTGVAVWTTSRIEIFLKSRARTNE
jgi:predicted nucleic acid-binding protein